MSHTITRNLVILTTILASFAAQADYFRWGDKNGNSRVKLSGSNPYLTSSNGRCYLYKGKAELNGGNFSLSNLTYIVWVDPNGNSTFGNYSASTASAYKSSDDVDATKAEDYTIIIVSKATSYLAPPSGAITPGEYCSIGIKTLKSVPSEDKDGNKFADIVLNYAYDTSTDYTSIPVLAWDVPEGNGGFAWGNKNSGNGRIPTNNEYITDKNARMYLYKGNRPTIDGRGVLDLGRLVYIDSVKPISGGYGKFGNYASNLTRSQLYTGATVEMKEGETYTVLVVTTDNTTGTIAVPLEDRQSNKYVAAYNATSTIRQTTDRWMYTEITMNKQILVADYNDGNYKTLTPITFYDHMEFTNPALATLDIPKSYVVGYVGADATDDQLMDATTNKWPTSSSPYALMESYTLNKDPNTTTDIPTVLPVQGSSTTSVQLNVSNVTVNEKANADVKYGLISSASPDFTDPTVEVDPQESPALEAQLPTSGVKYYRANLTIQGK